MNTRRSDQARKRIRKARPKRANRGIRATLDSLAKSDTQFDRDETDLESLDQEVLALLQEAAPGDGCALYNGLPCERAELNLYSELMRIALVTDRGSSGLSRAQRVAVDQLGTIIDFVEARGALGSDIDPLRLLQSSLADLLSGDRAPFLIVHQTGEKKRGRRLYPEYGRQLQYLSNLAIEAMHETGVYPTITDAARSWSKTLDKHKVAQIDGQRSRISAGLLQKWREELSTDPSFPALRERITRLKAWPKTPEGAKRLCAGIAKRLSRFHWWTQPTSDSA